MDQSELIVGENCCGQERARWLAAAGLHCCEAAITGGHKINAATETLHKNWPAFGHHKKKKKKEKMEKDKETVRERGGEKRGG